MSILEIAYLTHVVDHVACGGINRVSKTVIFATRDGKHPLFLKDR